MAKRNGYLTALALVALAALCALPAMAQEAATQGAPVRVRVVPNAAPPPPPQGALVIQADPLAQPSPAQAQAQAQAQASPTTLTPLRAEPVRVEPVRAVPQRAAPAAPVSTNPAARPVRTADVGPEAMARATAPDGGPERTAVTRRADTIARDLTALTADTDALSARLAQIQARDDANIRAYYADVASIAAQLQAGTTPANPRLERRLRDAEGRLEGLSAMVKGYTDVSRRAQGLSARTLVLSQDAAAAFALPGAVEEDHVALSALEDTIARAMVAVDRIGRTVTDDITRSSRAARVEQANLRMLSLAVSRGDMYGVGPAATLNTAGGAGDPTLGAEPTAGSAGPGAPARRQGTDALPPSWTPLLRVTFDKPSVNYAPPLHAAVHEALMRHPTARFSMVSVYPTARWESDGAAVPLEAAALDRHAVEMRDTLTAMGLAPERVALSSRWGQAQVGQIYLYMTP
jgi:hypothetical protein